jgi:hypothetical protein
MLLLRNIWQNRGTITLDFPEPTSLKWKLSPVMSLSRKSFYFYVGMICALPSEFSFCDYSKYEERTSMNSLIGVEEY